MSFRIILIHWLIDTRHGLVILKDGVLIDIFDRLISEIMSHEHKWRK